MSEHLTTTAGAPVPDNQNSVTGVGEAEVGTLTLDER